MKSATSIPGLRGEPLHRGNAGSGLGAAEHPAQERAEADQAGVDREVLAEKGRAEVRRGEPWQLSRSTLPAWSSPVSRAQLKTAQRGHKLLKDKRDELMKQFLDTVRESALPPRRGGGGADAGPQVLHGGLRPHVLRRHWSRPCCIPSRAWSSTRTIQNIMSVNVPVYDFQTKTKSDSRHLPLRLRRHLRRAGRRGGRPGPGVPGRC